MLSNFYTRNDDPEEAEAFNVELENPFEENSESVGFKFPPSNFSGV